MRRQTKRVKKDEIFKNLLHIKVMQVQKTENKNIKNQSSNLPGQ